MFGGCWGVCLFFCFLGCFGVFYGVFVGGVCLLGCWGVCLFVCLSGCWGVCLFVLFCLFVCFLALQQMVSLNAKLPQVFIFEKEYKTAANYKNRSMVMAVRKASSLISRDYSEMMSIRIESADNEQCDKESFLYTKFLKAKHSQ